MPELPEVETTRRGIEPWLQGRTVERVVVRQPQLRWAIPPEIQALAGQVIRQLTRRGKYILLHTDAGVALLHLGMSGSVRILDKTAALRKHDHFDVELDNGKVLRYHDPRRFGALLWTTDKPARHPLLCKLGVEPLEDAFTGDALFAKSRGRSLAIKAFIMDAHVVVGVGNIYANEALFMAGIDPRRNAGSLTLAEYTTLVACIQQVLNDALERGGTTLRDFVREDGETGYFQLALRVYGRSGQACVTCQTPLQHITQGQRSTWFCPSCQH